MLQSLSDQARNCRRSNLWLENHENATLAS